VVEESPEAILARLERYAERLRTGAAPAIRITQVPHSWTSPGAVAPTKPRPAPSRPADPPAAARPRYHSDYVAVAPGASALVGRTDDFIPPGAEEELEPVRHIGRSLLETGAMVAGLIACVATIALYMFFDRDIASIVVAGFACVGIYGMKERIPLSGWFTLGLGIGAALGLLS
jgi:hypothetical protein